MDACRTIRQWQRALPISLDTLPYEADRSHYGAKAGGRNRNFC